MSGPAEFVAAVSLFTLMIVIRLVNMVQSRFDTDESQHMHVIWAWARGFIQYRDVFDNHMPLFQIMFAPIFGLIGDRATILYWMRFILFRCILSQRGALIELGNYFFPGAPGFGRSF